jgi:hypothetical protein
VAALLWSASMRIVTWSFTVWALALLGCSAEQSSSEDAGETTAASSTVGESSTIGDGDEPEQPKDCGTVTITPTYTPPVVMYVVDTSSSMLTLWDHDDDPQTPEQSRWASARALVELTFELLDRPWAHPVVGLQRFPSVDACPSATSMSPSCADASACVVAPNPEVALAQQGATALLAALPGSNPAPIDLPGASPAAAAYASAVAQLVAGPYNEQFKTILLLTDGRSNCGADLEAPASLAVHDEGLLALVEAALEHNISTVVIAVDEAADPELELGSDRIPGFDPRPSLTAIGLAGGRPPSFNTGYYSASDPEAIAKALEGPADTPTCTIDLSQTDVGPPTPEQIPLVSWTINGEPIPYVEPQDCASQDGWTWLEPGIAVSFCGQACEAMKSLAGNTFEGRYGCPDSI